MYYLDDKIIGTVEKSPYALQYTIIGIKNGFHDLKAEAYDDIANTGSNTININYLLGPPTNSNSNSNNNTNSLNE